MKLFTAIAAWNNYLIIGADATTAFAQSPPPTEPTYMRIDDQNADWYKNKYGNDLDHSKVLPVLHALQGYPVSGALWGEHVDDFKAAGPNKKTICDLLNTIWGKIKITIEKKLLTHYNGIDYEQTCEYIKSMPLLTSQKY
eukprot:8278298-Ditylum_brightwellii.AAC.1